MGSVLGGQTIGVVGLGLMGRPMARNLARAGARVVIHNRSRAVVDELAAEGMIAADGAHAVAAAADTVILMLPDTDAVDRVLLGAGGVVEGLRPDALVIDMGTTDTVRTRGFADRVMAAGGAFVDAPVSGGEIGAREATLSIMAGGCDAAIARARPIFAVLGRRFTHVGCIGAGQIAKTANQVIVGLTIGAVAEALALAKRAGADPAKVRAALQGGFADSRILELHGQRMIEGGFAPGGKVATQLKDLNQALDLARALALPLPILERTRERFERLVSGGDGALDHSALYRLYDQG